VITALVLLIILHVDTLAAVIFLFVLADVFLFLIVVFWL
jgi:hypothetical protein